MSLIAEKDAYMQEVNELVESEQTIEKLEKLYDHLQEYIELDNVDAIIEEVLKELFSTKLSNEVNIPLSFHKTLIGKVIFTIMYGTRGNVEYSTKDIIELAKNIATEKSIKVNKSYINQDLRNNFLKGVKKNGKWVFTKAQVNEYFDIIKQRQYTKA